MGRSPERTLHPEDVGTGARSVRRHLCPQPGTRQRGPGARHTPAPTTETGALGGTRQGGCGCMCGGHAVGTEWHTGSEAAAPHSLALTVGTRRHVYSKPEHSAHSTCPHSRQAVHCSPSASEQAHGSAPGAPPGRDRDACARVGDTQGIWQNESQTRSPHTKPFHHDAVLTVTGGKTRGKAGIARALGQGV